jgi:nucleoid DNA-binding protein
MATLTKRDLVVQISEKTGFTQSQVLGIVQSTLDLITDAVSRGENVELRNFGVLEVRLTKPRIGRNPNKPGSEVPIPARATVKFKAGKVMRERVLKLTKSLKGNSAPKKAK